MTNSLKEKIVIGTWALSGDFEKYNQIFRRNVINYAISRGFFEFDTAPVYGKGISGKILSKVCKKYNFLKSKYKMWI